MLLPTPYGGEGYRESQVLSMGTNITTDSPPLAGHQVLHTLLADDDG